MGVFCIALIVPVSIHFPHGPADQKHTARFTNKETEAGRGMSYARSWLELRSLLHFTRGPPSNSVTTLRTLFKSWFTLESWPVPAQRFCFGRHCRSETRFWEPDLTRWSTAGKRKPRPKQRRVQPFRTGLQVSRPAFSSPVAKSHPSSRQEA